MYACYVHTYHVQGCPDCHALRTSVYLRYARAACPTPAEQAKLDALKESYRPTWEDARAPSSVTDELDRFIAEWMRGEVDAT